MLEKTYQNTNALANTTNNILQTSTTTAATTINICLGNTYHTIHLIVTYQFSHQYTNGNIIGTDNWCHIRDTGKTSCCDLVSPFNSDHWLSGVCTRQLSISLSCLFFTSGSWWIPPITNSLLCLKTLVTLNNPRCSHHAAQYNTSDI